MEAPPGIPARQEASPPDTPVVEFDAMFDEGWPRGFSIVPYGT